MADLEQALRDLGEHLDYPAPPHLVAAVRLRLAEAEPAATRRRLPVIPTARRGVLVSSATAFVVLVLSVLGFWAPAREAVADLFGLRGVLFSRAPSPVHPGESLRLGKTVGFDAARRAVDFPLRIPARLGPPDAVYAASSTASGGIDVPLLGLAGLGGAVFGAATGHRLKLGQRFRRAG